jgi:hypothetical protein
LPSLNGLVREPSSQGRFPGSLEFPIYVEFHVLIPTFQTTLSCGKKISVETKRIFHSVEIKRIKDSQETVRKTIPCAETDAKRHL